MFVFSTAASRSLFSQEISIHCYSYFRGFWSNDLTNAATFKTSKCFFSWTVLPRTDHGRRNRPGFIGLLHAASTLLLWNLKRKVYSDNPSNVFRRNYVGEIQKRKNNRPFEKLCFQKVFRPHENENPAFVNSSGLRRVFENVHFRYSVDGRQTLEIKLHFQISPTVRTLPIIVWKRSTRFMCINRGHEMYGLNDKVRWKTMKSEQWNVLGHLRKQKGKRWRQ